MTRLLTAAFALALAPAALAQSPQYRPGNAVPFAPRATFSPYLNLNRPGNLAVNYYGIVRPEVEFRNNIGGLQRNVGDLTQAVTAPATAATAAGPTTGVVGQFGFYSHYYRGVRTRSFSPAAPSTGTAGVVVAPAVTLPPPTPVR